MSTEKVSHSQYFPPTETDAREFAIGGPDETLLSVTTDLPARSETPAFPVFPSALSSLPTLVEGGGIRVTSASETVSVLLIGRGEPDETAARSAHNVRRVLARVGQGVMMCSRQHWRSLLEINAPEIIVIDAAHHREEMRQLCREVKTECEPLGALIVIAVPTTRDAADHENWEPDDSLGILAQCGRRCAA